MISVKWNVDSAEEMRLTAIFAPHKTWTDGYYLLPRHERVCRDAVDLPDRTDWTDAPDQRGRLPGPAAPLPFS